MSIADHALLRLTIDLDAVVGNWHTVRAKLGKTTRAAAVVKADCYGLGADQVVPALVRAGCTAFFVATLDEGIQVRHLAPQAEIMVLSGPVPGSEDAFPAHTLTPVLNAPEQLLAWRDLARTHHHPLDAVLHVDTGMTRLGFDRDYLTPDRLAGLKPVLIMSHLACADQADHAMNRQQLAEFQAMTHPFPGIARSLAASCGIYLGADYHFDLVRPGAALYGLNPVSGQPNPLRPVVRLQARILQVRDVDSPRTVGYGASGAVKAGQRIATVAAGYADGVFRSLGNRGQAVVGGIKVPVIGRVSMDLITVDVSALPPSTVHPGSYIDLIGPQQDADAVAAMAGTIGYEILTQLPRRAARHYVGEKL